MIALPHPLQLAIGSDVHIVTTMAMLDHHWACYAAEPWVECWLTLPAGPRLLLLTSHTRVHLLYLATDDDLGWHIVGDAPGEAAAVVVECRLANGQRDALPWHWTIPREQAWQAARQFATTGHRPDGVRWHANGVDDELDTMEEWAQPAAERDADG